MWQKEKVVIHKKQEKRSEEKGEKEEVRELGKSSKFVFS